MNTTYVVVNGTSYHEKTLEAVHASFESIEKARWWVHKLGVTAPIAA